jgi:GNAT superfamily N-acetyltransferase
VQKPIIMKTIEVISPTQKKQFHQVPRKLYLKSEAWVSPLDNEMEDIFNPEKNNAFKEGDACRWLLTDNHGKLIGRVAAFYQEGKTDLEQRPIGGMGFFESVENKNAAFLLFNTAREWLEKKGMKAMDGPVNFGENDSHWGLLVEGFTHPGFGMPFHKPYYRSLFEEYGFQNYFEQYSYHLDLTQVTRFPERFEKIAKWVSKKPGYSFRHFTFKETDTFIAAMVEVYNETWAVFKKDFIPLDHKKLKSSFEKAKFIIDEELAWFAYHEDEPVAFFIIFPDINQILRHLDGKLDPWGMLKFWWFKKRGAMNRMRAVVAGVKPKYQNLGLETVIFYELFKVFRKKSFYKELELSWVGDFNPKMRSMYEAIGAKQAKTHITYRYYFEEGIKVKRYMDEKKIRDEAEAKDVNN